MTGVSFLELFTGAGGSLGGLGHSQGLGQLLFINRRRNIFVVDQLVPPYVYL